MRKLTVRVISVFIEDGLGYSFSVTIPNIAMAHVLCLLWKVSRERNIRRVSGVDASGFGGDLRRKTLVLFPRKIHTSLRSALKAMDPLPDLCWTCD